MNMCFLEVAVCEKCTSSHIPCLLAQSSNRNIRKRCEICSKLTLKTPEWHQLWTYFTPFFLVSLADFEQVNVSWVFFRLCKKALQEGLTINKFAVWKILTLGLNIIALITDCFKCPQEIVSNNLTQFVLG